MLKLVDKPDLGSGAERRMGSIPFARTRKKLSYIAGLFSSAQVPAGAEAPSLRSKCQSDSSKVNISFTLFWNRYEIFKARIVDGLNLPFSIALIVCLLTSSASAKSCWVISKRALSTFILFFISHPPHIYPYHYLVECRVSECQYSEVFHKEVTDVDY